MAARWCGGRAPPPEIWNSHIEIRPDHGLLKDGQGVPPGAGVVVGMPRPPPWPPPAKHHRWCSSSKFLSRVLMHGEAPLKTHAFRCFHILQAPRMITVFSPFFFSFGILFTAHRHQLAKEVSSTVGTLCCRFSLERMRDQNSLANTQEVSKCCTFSSA